jgi:hypothetical protein
MDGELWCKRYNYSSNFFSVAEQKILASITDTIIPAGNSIGALSVGVDKFLQKLIDDCYEKNAQDNVKTQLKSLEDTAKTINKNHLLIVPRLNERVCY